MISHSLLLRPPTGPALVSAANRLFWSRVSDVGDDDGGRLTTGQITGIVVAVIVCAVLIAVVVVVTVYVKRRGCVTQREPATPAAAT